MCRGSRGIVMATARAASAAKPGLQRRIMDLQKLLQARKELLHERKISKEAIQARHKTDWDDFDKEFKPKLDALNGQISQASNDGVGKRIKSTMKGMKKW